MAVARPPSKRQRRIEELQILIRSRFPDAKFYVQPVPDARGVTGIWTYTSADPDDLRDLVRDREYEIMANDKIQLLTIAMPPEEYRE